MRANLFFASFLASGGWGALWAQTEGRAVEPSSASARPLSLPPAPPGRIDFSADSVDFAESAVVSTAPNGTLLRMEGHVILKESTWTIRAGEILVDLDSRTAAISNGMEMDDGTSVVYGRSGLFDLAAREGSLKGARAGYPPWRIRADEADLFADRRVRFRRARFTSCDEKDPDYHLRASSVYLKPKKYLLAWNPVFYVRSVPLFYSPFLWKSLREKHLIRARVNPGYDRRNGAFARTTTLFDIAPSLYGKLYLDYYGAQGPGVGSELQYHASEEGRGALYGYRIRENHSGQERWAVFGDSYRTIRSSYAFQARLQAQSDAEFNNHYARSNAFRLTPELVNGAAFVRRTSLATTRISYSRLDRQDPAFAQTRFIRESESMPRVEFQTAPLALRGSSWLTTINLFADNRFERPREFLQRSAGACAETTRVLRIVRGLSLTPYLGVGETYESRRDDATSAGSIRTFQDAFVGHYQLGGDLRLNSRFGYWDAQYALNRRLKPGTLQDDAGALDRGVERNLLTLQDTLFPRPRVVLRFGTGYDFRRPRNEAMGLRKRVQPFFADINWSAGGGWQFSVRDDYQLGEGNRAFLAQADWGERTGTFAGFGMVHTLGRPESYLASAAAGWAPSSSSWRVEGALRFDAHAAAGVRFDSVQMFEKELSIVKDLHDFHTRLLLRVRPGGVKEASFRFELLGGLEAARKIVKKGWESEWFPWRKTQSEDFDSD